MLRGNGTKGEERAAGRRVTPSRGREGESRKGMCNAIRLGKNLNTFFLYFFLGENVSRCVVNKR